jgi:Domain of unknown function (DUF4411)
VQAVADEINAGDDELTAWLKQQPSSFRVAPDSSDQAALQEVAQWAQTCGRFTSTAKTTFLSVADYFLVSQARTRAYTVVTGETVADPQAKTRIKIPDACAAVRVPCINLFQMLKAERVRLT